LRLLAEFDRGQLRILELRVLVDGVVITAEGWDDAEPALAITLYDLAVAPPSFSEKLIPLSVIGLHALARRYQRGADYSDAAVLDDLRVLARDGLAAFKAGGEFAIPAPSGGRWIGAVRPEDRVVIIRTYFGNDYK
jgi:hypothetical protein